MRILYCLLLLGLCGSLRANEIDQLRTKEEVKVFLVKRVDKKYKGEVFEGTPPDTNGYGHRFFTFDVDGNGLTDLVVNDTYLFIVFDEGRKGYVVREPGGRKHDFHRTELVGIDSSVLPLRLVVGQEKYSGRRQDPPGYRKDTVVFYSGDFIEFNDRPDTALELQEIKVRTNHCFGSCPIFEMAVDGKGAARYHAIEFNKEEGLYTGTVPTGEFATMMGVLRYLPLQKLDSSYTVDWTDDQTIELEIRYKGGVKRIVDYGEVGSYGLIRLYGFFFRWKELVKWEAE